MSVKREEIKVTQEMEKKLSEEFSRIMREFTPEEEEIFRRIRRTHIESQKARFDLTKPLKDLLL